MSHNFSNNKYEQMIQIISQTNISKIKLNTCTDDNKIIFIQELVFNDKLFKSKKIPQISEQILKLGVTNHKTHNKKHQKFHHNFQLSEILQIFTNFGNFVHILFLSSLLFLNLKYFARTTTENEEITQLALRV